MQMTAYVGAHITAPIAALDMDQLRKTLLVRNKSHAHTQAFSKVEIPEYVVLWEEDEDMVIVPRGYTLPLRAGVELVYEWVGPVWEGSDWPGFRMEFDEARNQFEAWEALTKYAGLALTPDDKTLCLSCGKGKTVLALAYAAWRGVPTLVVVDRIAIGDQWVERAFDALGIPRQEIGWIQENQCKVGKHLTVALAHTLSRRMLEYPMGLWDHFGLVIFDESHVMAAPLFNQLAPMFTGERLCLSATPNRRDGLEPCTMLHSGGMVPCYTNTVPLRSKRWVFKSLPRIVDSFREYSCYRLIGGRAASMDDEGSSSSKVLLLHKYFKAAAEHEGWFNLICSDIARAYEEGRTMLILGVQIAHLRQLEVWCAEQGYSVGCVEAATKQGERKDAFKQRIILATEKLAGKALDIQALDTLFLLVPYADINRLIQEGDRIGRDANNEREPRVTVYCHDAIKSMKYKAQEMRRNVRTVDKDAIIVEETITQL